MIPSAPFSTKVAKNVRNETFQMVPNGRVGSVRVFKIQERRRLKVRFPQGMNHIFTPANKSAAHGAASCTVSLHGEPKNPSKLPLAQAEDLPEELALLFGPVGPTHDPPGLFSLRQFEHSKFPRVHFHLLRFSG